MKMGSSAVVCPEAGDEVGVVSGAIEPATESDPGTREAQRIVAAGFAGEHEKEIFE